MKRLLAALRFLTVLPVPARWAGEEGLVGSTVCFPVVGLLIGGAAVAMTLGLARVLPTPLVSVVIVIALEGISGGLHLDGLADTTDAFLSSRGRERMLEIMKDSHIGAMGALAIVCVFSLKVAALSSVPREALWRAVLLMPLAGRCALAISVSILPYARPTGGLGSVFYRRRSRFDGAWAASLLALVGWLAYGMAGLVAAVTSILAVLALAGYTYRKIGGATGDTLGATCEIAEVIPAVTLAAWLYSV